MTLPGFHHDTLSSVYPAAVASPVWGRMPLDFRVPPELDFPAFRVFATNYPAYKIFMLAISIAIFRSEGTE